MPTLDEDALKKFIAELPDLKKEHEADALGDDERLYLFGILDAYHALKGEPLQAEAMAEILRSRARPFRIPHEPEWVPASLTGTYCKVCETTQAKGDVPWHTSLG